MVVVVVVIMFWKSSEPHATPRHHVPTLTLCTYSNTGHGSGHGALQDGHGGKGHVLGRVLDGAVLTGAHHVGLEQGTFQVDAVLVEALPNHKCRTESRVRAEPYPECTAPSTEIMRKEIDTIRRSQHTYMIHGGQDGRGDIDGTLQVMVAIHQDFRLHDGHETVCLMENHRRYPG